MPQDDSMHALNQMLDILDGQIKKASRGRHLNGAGTAKLGATARMRIDAAGGNPNDFFSELDKGVAKDVRAAPEANPQASPVDALEQQVKECQHIVDRYAREVGAAHSQGHQALQEHFDLVYKDPQQAFDNFDRLANSTDIEKTAEELIQDVGQRVRDVEPRNWLGAAAMGDYLQRRQDERFGFSNLKDGRKEILEIKAKLEAQGVDIQNGGQRIFAREVVKEMPGLLGSPRGERFILADKERRNMEKAVKNFEPQAQIHLDNDVQIAIAEHNHEVADHRMKGMEEDMALVRDRADLERMANLDQGLEEAVNGPQAGQTPSKDDSFDMDR